MVDSVEILIAGNEKHIGAATLQALVKGSQQAGLKTLITNRYHGKAKWLCLWGVGDPLRDEARCKHVRTGRPVACWDLGYVGEKVGLMYRYMRVSINDNHPWRLFDVTPNDPKRWEAHRLRLRNDYDPEGKVLVIGMGRKSRTHLKLFAWEKEQLVKAEQRFPERQVMYRPKFGRSVSKAKDSLVQWKLLDGLTPIETLLHHTSLVICRHSNVAIDACIAGVPVECEDGAAYWLYRNGSNPTEAQRLDFLHRLSWWQWNLYEMKDVWKFLQQVYG